MGEPGVGVSFPRPGDSGSLIHRNGVHLALDCVFLAPPALSPRLIRSSEIVNLTAKLDWLPPPPQKKNKKNAFFWEIFPKYGCFPNRAKKYKSSKTLPLLALISPFGFQFSQKLVGRWVGSKIWESISKKSIFLGTPLTLGGDLPTDLDELLKIDVTLKKKKFSLKA